VKNSTNQGKKTTPLIRGVLNQNISIKQLRYKGRGFRCQAIFMAIRGAYLAYQIHALIKIKTS